MLLLVFVSARVASRGCTETIHRSAWLHALSEGLLKVNWAGLALGGTKPGRACSSLTGRKDGLSEPRCLALLEARGMQGVQQHQQSLAAAGEALCREEGWVCYSSSLACHSSIRLVEMFSGSSGQNGFIRGNHSTGLSICVSDLWSWTESVWLWTLEKTLEKASLILLSLRIHQEDAVRQVWGILSSQLGRCKTKTILHFLFLYIVAFPGIYTTVYPGHWQGRLHKPFGEFIFHLLQLWGCGVIEWNSGIEEGGC